MTVERRCRSAPLLPQEDGPNRFQEEVRARTILSENGAPSPPVAAPQSARSVRVVLVATSPDPLCSCPTTAPSAESDICTVLLWLVSLPSVLLRSRRCDDEEQSRSASARTDRDVGTTNIAGLCVTRNVIMESASAELIGAVDVVDDGVLEAAASSSPPLLSALLVVGPLLAGENSRGTRMDSRNDGGHIIRSNSATKRAASRVVRFDVVPSISS